MSSSFHADSALYLEKEKYLAKILQNRKGNNNSSGANCELICLYINILLFSAASQGAASRLISRLAGEKDNFINYTNSEQLTN